MFFKAFVNVAFNIWNFGCRTETVQNSTIFVKMYVDLSAINSQICVLPWPSVYLHINFSGFNTFLAAAAADFRRSPPQPLSYGKRDKYRRKKKKIKITNIIAN